MSSNNNDPFEKINNQLTEVRKSLATANAKTLDEQSLHSHHDSFMNYYEEGLALLDAMKSEPSK
ncbi:hypothetical protein [Piscirickettsia litoralis]|uniref:Uncharacterized protein n=1 Tax=Piscirickettsia litoralis TaxID=1891921 RepID=A0ABX3A486_9GAMM|nr:hypothetical protein [Piscirickettsia litoralis]ODN43434.1 hypothetical protein BGC07_11535 [Piscirickettsia litoralis]